MAERFAKKKNFCQHQHCQHTTHHTPPTHTYTPAPNLTLPFSLQALEERTGTLEALKASLAALEGDKAALQADRDALVARNLAALNAAEGARGARDAELEGARSAAEAAIGALREAQGEVGALRSHVRALEEEGRVRGEQESELLGLLAAAQGEAALARAEYGDKLLLTTQVAHLQLDNGRLLALLRSTREYAAVAGKISPGARAAGVRAAGGDEDRAADAASGAPGGYLRSTYVGSAFPRSLPNSECYLGGVPSGARLPAAAGGATQHRGTGAAAAAAAAAAASLGPKWDALSGLEDAYGGYAASVGAGVEALRAERSAAAAAAALAASAASAGASEGALLERALEMQRWIPSDAAALCSAFRQRYLNHVDVEDVRAFLVGLNIAWAARGEEEVTAARAALLKKCKEYRRALAQRLPYREVMQASTIVRINQELVTLRHKQGLSGGVPNPAVPIRDHEEHGVAFGRTTLPRAVSPVRAFLARVHRGEGEGGEEEEAVDADAAQALLSGALREAAVRLRSSLVATPAAVAAAATASASAGGNPPFPVSLSRVPGSGARRLDAIEAAQLLEGALAAVDDLGATNKDLRHRVKSLEGELEEARREAQEEAHLRASASALHARDGSGRLQQQQHQQHQQHQQQHWQQQQRAPYGGFAAEVTATLGSSQAGSTMFGGGGGGSSSGSSSSSAAAGPPLPQLASYGSATAAAKILYPAPPPLPPQHLPPYSDHLGGGGAQQHPPLRGPPSQRLGRAGPTHLPLLQTDGSPAPWPVAIRCWPRPAQQPPQQPQRSASSSSSCINWTSTSSTLRRPFSPVQCLPPLRRLLPG